MTSERYLVLGTAGHIDHGKTSLVRALTGTDTDRLAEEKARGITIDLGFAQWRLPDGTQLGVIDVPGHRRFIRNMVAGAAGIDMVMLVVAADDGVMPQTIEHLQIARLLGVRHGLVALTKADVVDPELLELARSDIEQQTRGTFLEGTPIIAVSSVTGAGLDELTSEVMRSAAQVQLPQDDAPLRMPIDRAFTIKGAGTVVTGTIHAGTLRDGEEIAILPAGKRVRVRGLQLHGASVDAIGPRHRAAINLVGVEKEELQRGDVLAAPDSLVPTDILDASIELLPGKLCPLRSGTWVELHIGTAEVGARIVPLSGESVAAGSSAIAQLKLESLIACAAGDRFILRGSTGERTVGGGVVLDSHPTVHRRSKLKVAEGLSELAAETSDTASMLRHEIAKAQFGLTRSEALKLLSVGESALDDAASALADGDLIAHSDGRGVFYTLPQNLQRIAALTDKALAVHHSAHPLRRRGLTAAELAQAIGHSARIPAGALQAALAQAVDHGALKQVDDTFALATHAPKINAREEQAATQIATALEASMSPQQPEELAAVLGLSKERLRHVVDYLLEEKQALLAPGGVFFGAQQISNAKVKLRAHLAQQNGITVSDLNALLGTTRKYGIPLLQLWEGDGMLVRDGDVRRLKAKG
ncbi:MAG: selenocysteine-specific translation elongation factor [bacterium]|nr:selenocysteine-specific translation elongation factor [bacterium]